MLLTDANWSRPTPDYQESVKIPFFQRLRKLLANVRLCVFMLHAFVMGASASIIGSFLFVYLKDAMDASSTLLGLTLVLSVAGEIPFFFFSNWILKKIGFRGMVAASHIGYVVRFLLYTVIQNPWFVLPVELLHALTFAAMWSAGILYSAENSPPGLEATGQGLFIGVYSGIGGGAQRACFGLGWIEGLTRSTQVWAR
jgi:Na+/melibiose symporter-like transporter